MFLSQIGLRWSNLPTNEKADIAVGTRQRKLEAPLQEYLLSRSDAGATHEDLLKGMTTLTSGKVLGRFFHMFPSRPQDLFQWMVTWMRKGAVLVASLNLQKQVPQGMPVPDAWHHQMIYGVIESGVFTLNPHEFIPFTTLVGQLSSESTIMIQAEDIVHRWVPKTDMSLLSHGRWEDLAVTQNINKLIYSILTFQPYDSHVTIPASYKSGITVFCTENSDAGRAIQAIQ